MDSHITYPVNRLELKYPKSKPLGIFRRYFYAYVHLLCIQQHISLRKESSRLGWHHTYLSASLITYGRKDTLAKIATCVTKQLNPTKKQINQINTDIFRLFPHLLHSSKWRQILKRELFWKSLGKLNPLGKAVKHSGKSIKYIAKYRHVHYATVYVSLKASRVSLPTLYETADILQISPSKLALEFRPDLPYKEAIRRLELNLKDYLRKVNVQQFNRHRHGIYLILRDYLSLSRLLKTALAILFQYYRPLNIPLLQGLHYIPRLKDLEYNSPAYSLILALKVSHACCHKGDFSFGKVSHVKVNRILHMQSANDSIPLNTAEAIEHYLGIHKPIFKNVNKLYNLYYQKLYFDYLKRLNKKGISPMNNDGNKLMYFRCVHGISAVKMGLRLHLSHTRVDQFIRRKHLSHYWLTAIAKAYPKYKDYFLPQRIVE